jgi:hypothetical protein
MDYLRRRTAMPENVDRNFLECLLPGIDCAVDTIGRFDPIDLAGAQLGVNGRASVTKFHRQGVAAEHHRYSMPRVAMPRGSLAGREAHPSNQRCSMVVQDFLEQGLDRFRGTAQGDAPKAKSIYRALRNATASAAASYISGPDPASLWRRMPGADPTTCSQLP